MFSHCLHCACGRQLTLSNFSVRALPFPCAEFEPDVAAETLPVILQQLGINRAALIRAAARRALIDEAAAKQLLLVLAKGAHGIERGCREWKKRRYEGASGAPRLHFSWVNALASSEKIPLTRSPNPPQHQETQNLRPKERGFGRFSSSQAHSFVSARSAL